MKTAKKVVGIIQARMGSARLPGKSMLPIMGKPLLLHVIERIKSAKMLNLICVATTENSVDDPIVNLANLAGIDVFRGSENDVLDRFVRAAETYNPDIVVRICADNPLIDPREIDKLIKFHIDSQVDYSNNNEQHSQSLPDGSGAESISFSALLDAHRTSTEQPHREHVTLFIKENPHLFKIKKLDADLELVRPRYRLDVDYLEDLAFVREVYARLYSTGRAITTKNIITLLDRHPALLELRKHRA